MFDVGFWELMVVAVVGLLVLGPERLPGAVRTVAGWLRWLRSSLDAVKHEINQELQLDELHRVSPHDEPEARHDEAHQHDGLESSLDTPPPDIPQAAGAKPHNKHKPGSQP